MIVTIDGPAGVGKSTVAKGLADRLGFQFLNTGAMYRAVTAACLRSGVTLQDPRAVARFARGVSLRFEGERIFADGQDVTDELASEAVRDSIMHVTDNPSVREHLVQLQRRMVAEADYVSEGRDQGTVAFPDAVCKFFMTADPRERAERRLQQLTRHGQAMTLDAILEEQTERDRRDENRPVGPLRKAADAVTVDTSRRSVADVIDQMEQEVRKRVGR
jgi:cytidylate kinase